LVVKASRLCGVACATTGSGKALIASARNAF